MPGTRTTQESPTRAALQALRSFIMAIDRNAAAGGWQKGPRSTLRGNRDPVTVAKYVQWLRALETGPLGRRESSAALVQRLRRLCYSVWTVPFFDPGTATPWMFDVVTQRVTDYARPPLTTDDVSQDVLDGLFGTGAIVTASGLRVAMFHVWAAADLILNGESVQALVSKGVLLRGTVLSNATWLGDLAIPAKAYAELVKSSDGTAAGRQALMDTLIRDKCAKEDLLGDLDGIVIGRHWARHPGFGIAAFVEAYYAADVGTPNAAQLGRPSAARRFHHFLADAVPELPIGGRDSNPLAVTFDPVTSRATIRGLLAAAADDMAVKQRLELLEDDPIDFFFRQRERLPPIEDELAGIGATDQFYRLGDEFGRFLGEGVRTGDGTWPPA
jgi:hypothetical protein